MVPKEFTAVSQVTGQDLAVLTAAMYLGGLEDAERQILKCENVCRDGFEFDTHLMGLLVCYLRAERSRYENILVETYGAEFLSAARCNLARTRFVSNLESQFSDGAEKEDHPENRG